MKRFPIVISATAAGLAGILTFHSRSASVPLTRTSAASAKTSGGISKATSNPTATTSPPTTTASPSPSPSSSPSSSAPVSAVGAPEQYGYGVLSVRVTVSGTRITDVSMANLQTAESYSQQIANQVIPYLRHQVLALQSSQINGISGATYTSEAYSMSVQSALDK
ncbi:MAG: FMN-binding protein, partial [Acidimicrobiales bacterium]